MAGLTAVAILIEVEVIGGGLGLGNGRITEFDAQSCFPGVYYQSVLARKGTPNRS